MAPASSTHITFSSRFWPSFPIGFPIFPFHHRHHSRQSRVHISTFRFEMQPQHSTIIKPPSPSRFSYVYMVSHSLLICMRLLYLCDGNNGTMRYCDIQMVHTIHDTQSVLYIHKHSRAIFCSIFSRLKSNDVEMREMKLVFHHKRKFILTNRFFSLFVFHFVFLLLLPPIFIAIIHSA